METHKAEIRVLHTPLTQDVSKHQVKYGEHTYDLEVHASNCGATVAYTRTLTEEEKKKRGPMIFLGPGADKDVLTHQHIHPLWWWKFVGRTVESEIARFVRETKQDAENYRKNKEAVTRFLQ